MITSDFQAWAAEIQIELKEATEALAVAESALADAQTARDLANAENRRVASLLAGLSAQDEDARATGRLWGMPMNGMSAYLLRRGDPAAEAARQAEGNLSFAKQIVENARWRVEDLNEALAVLSKAMNTEQETTTHG
jgi:hypothetical protein